MGNRIVGTPNGGGSASARKSASPLRYLPATLASLLLLAALIATGASRIAEPGFFGLFLRGKGGPPPSRSTLIVSGDPGAGPLDAAAAARLAAAILERGPAVVAIGPIPAEDPGTPIRKGPATGEVMPSGPLVITHAFAAYRPWTVSDNAGRSYPPILAASLYPLLDGPEPGLSLPLGEGLELDDTLITQGPRVAGGQEPTTGFVPSPNAGALFSLPGFVRLERGVVAGLGLEAARRALGVPAGKIGYIEGAGILFNADHVLAIDPRGEFPLRFHGPEGIPRLPASRFLEGRVSASEVRGKMVFVDPASSDGPRIRTVAGPRTSTEIQASAAANFLDGTAVTSPAWGRALPLIIGLLFVCLLLLAMALDLGPSLLLLLAVFLALLYPAVSWLLFVKSSLWLPPELPPLMVAALYLPYALTRLLSPAPAKYASRPAIQPSPIYDPALVSMPSLGRPAAGAMPAGPLPRFPGDASPYASGPTTPARGIPMSGQAGPAIPSQGTPIPGQSAPAPLKARPQAPRERQGAPADYQPEARPAAPPAFSDPRDPPIIPMARSQAPEPRPVPTQPRPAAPAAHTGTVGDDIERDAKGGLVRVGKYRIVRKMGFGSGGDVFEGFDTHMGRKVAIKTITKNAAAHFDRASERFVLEAKAAGSLNHPCINTIYDFGTIRDVSYMVLEFLDGITLSQWMRGNPEPPRPAAIAHWLQQISSALDYAHGHKVIHRDLKPANLMVVNNGGTVKLLDFGIAKMEDVGLTQTGMTVGTPSYMSPEQLSGIKVGPASDQYGLAVVIYQLFTYKLPYVGTKIPELCNRILKNEIVPITDVNASLGAPFWAALRKAMSKQPEERYPNCMAMCAALEAAFPSP